MKKIFIALLMLVFASVSPLFAKDKGPRETWPGWAVDLADLYAEPGGRVVAHLNGRRGWLAGNKDAQADIMRNLKPLDILVERSRGRLSSRLIPGWFGHTAIYLGTEKQLRTAGVWNDPNVFGYRQKVKNGEVFIEAEHKGVHLARQKAVFNTDSLAVFRPRLTPSQHARALRAFFGHIGTKFDFKFNPQDDGVLFCAELAEHAIPGMRFPRRMMYGRTVLLPVDIAAAGLAGRSRLSFVLYVRGTAQGVGKASAAQMKTDISNGW